jgi:hypothetical protein
MENGFTFICASNARNNANADKTVATEIGAEANEASWKVFKPQCQGDQCT